MRSARPQIFCGENSPLVSPLLCLVCRERAGGLNHVRSCPDATPVSAYVCDARCSYGGPKIIYSEVAPRLMSRVRVSLSFFFRGFAFLNFCNNYVVWHLSYLSNRSVRMAPGCGGGGLHTSVLVVEHLYGEVGLIL